MRWWKENHFKSIHNNYKQIEKEKNDLNKKEKEVNLNEKDVWKKRNLQEKFPKAIMHITKSKSRFRWLKEGRLQ